MAYATAHNGGRTQVNLGFPSIAGDYCFLNLMKNAEGYWGSITGGVAYPLQNLTDDGYPHTIVNGGCFIVFFVPTNAELTAAGRTNRFVAKWDGIGTIHVGMNNTAQDGTSKTNTVDGQGRYVFTSTDSRFVIGISAIGATPISNLRVCMEADEAALDAGEVFGVKFLERLAELKPGVIRMLDWQAGNRMSACKWANRRPLSWPFYSGHYTPPSLYAGETTNSGDDYTVAAPTTFDGLTHGSQVLVKFNAASTASRINAITITAANPAVVTATGHTYSNGDPVGFGTSSLLPAPLVPFQSYFVKNVSGDTFEVALTAGGTSISTSGATQSGTHFVIREPRIDIGGTGLIPIKNNYGSTVVDGDNTRVFAVTQMLVYDETFQKWIKYGTTGDSGILEGPPPELHIQLCATIGAHVWETTPYLTSDPLTDWMPEMATLYKEFCETNNITWMKHIYELVNESWNSGADFLGTRYGWNKAQAYGWGNQQTTRWAGKIGSVIGQALSAVYGDDRTKYEVIAGVQTVSTPSDNNECMTSSYYVAQSQDPQEGYTKSAASDWLTGVACANYYGSAYFKSGRELIDAVNWEITYNGDETQQDAILEAHVAGCIEEGVVANSNFSIPRVLARVSAWKTWADGYNKKLFCYEGGYSPDYTAVALTSPITGATQDASGCVLTLASTLGEGGEVRTGNGAVVGQTLSIASVGGMTQLNGNTYTISEVNVGDDTTKVRINVNSSGFSAYTSGGTATYVNSAAIRSRFRKATKFAEGMSIAEQQILRGLDDLDVSYPSLYLFSGPSEGVQRNLTPGAGGTQVWGYLDPSVYAEPSKAWYGQTRFNSNRVLFREV